jgi:hypothetical protein
MKPEGMSEARIEDGGRKIGEDREVRMADSDGTEYRISARGAKSGIPECRAIFFRKSATESEDRTGGELVGVQSYSD